MKTFTIGKLKRYSETTRSRLTAVFIALTMGLSVCAISYIALPRQASASNDLAMPDGFTEVSATDAFLPKQDVPYDILSMTDGPVKISILNSLAIGSMSKYADNMFRPDKAVTRAELAVAIDRTFQLPSNKNKIKIKDVKTSYWAYASIKRAIKYMPLYKDGSFRPSAAATREDVAAVLVAVSGVRNTGSNPSSIDIMFADADTVSPEIKETMSVAIDSGLMKAYKVGDAYYLKPQGIVTRAELAYLLDQGMSKISTGLKTAPKAAPKKNVPKK